MSDQPSQTPPTEFKAGLALERNITRVIATYLAQDTHLLTLHVTPAFIEWTEQIGNVEYRCSIGLTVTVKATDFAAPEPEDA